MKKLLIVVVTALVLLAIPSVLASEITETSIGDAFVRSDKPDSNYGSNPTMKIGASEGEMAAGIIKFSQNVPDNSEIESATLRLYFAKAPINPENELTVNLKVITENWNEGTVTYNNRPDFDSTTVDSITVTDDFGWVEFDVTKVVRHWVRGQIPNFGFGLMPLRPADTAKKFYTKENSALEPELVIEYTAP